MVASVQLYHEKWFQDIQFTEILSDQSNTLLAKIFAEIKRREVATFISLKPISLGLGQLCPTPETF